MCDGFEVEHAFAVTPTIIVQLSTDLVQVVTAGQTGHCQLARFSLLMYKHCNH